MSVLRRLAMTIKWRFFDRYCPYKLSVCWQMSDSDYDLLARSDEEEHHMRRFGG